MTDHVFRIKGLYILLITCVLMSVVSASGQTRSRTKVHVVQAKETVYGLARQYGLIVTLFTFLFSFLILMYGEIIINVVSAYVRGVVGYKFQISYAWFVLRWVLGMGVYFFMVSYIYYVLPTNRVSFRNIVPGSLVASLSVISVLSTLNLHA